MRDYDWFIEFSPACMFCQYVTGHGAAVSDNDTRNHNQQRPQAFDKIP